jgi:hypothetical protein
MSQIVIDLDKIDELSTQADKVFISADGEKVILDLLEAKERVEQALEKAKQIIKEKMEELDPNLVSIQGDQIKVQYRYFGNRYSYLNTENKSFLVEKTNFTVDTKKVEEYVKENKNLPEGIVLSERVKQVVFKAKKGRA